MRVMIDVAHPAHVHYFKNFAHEFIQRGHAVLFTANDRPMVQYLLDKFELKYKFRGHRTSSMVGKIYNSFQSYHGIYRVAKKFKPDLFLDMGTVYAAPIAWLLRKPYIAMDDTEASIRARFLHMPFTTSILTPESFYLDLGKKQIRFKGNMELLYLHPNRFKPDPSIKQELGITEHEKYIVIRFVAWDAHHDVNQSGLTMDEKFTLTKELVKYGRVFISSEAQLSGDLKKYQINIPPEKMHDVLAFASLYIGEGATMASECAVLGIPVLYLNDIYNGYLREEEKYKLLLKANNIKEIKEKLPDLFFLTQDDKNKRKSKMIDNMIDVTAFLVWFVENYPESARIMKENPEYQWRFR